METIVASYSSDFGQTPLNKGGNDSVVKAAVKDAISRRGLDALKRFVKGADETGADPDGYIEFVYDRTGGSVDNNNPSKVSLGDFTIVTLLIYDQIGRLIMVAPGVSKRSIADKNDDPYRGLYTAAFRAAAYADRLLTDGVISSNGLIERGALWQ